MRFFSLAYPPFSSLARIPRCLLSLHLPFIGSLILWRPVRWKRAPSRGGEDWYWDYVCMETVFQKTHVAVTEVE